MQGRNIADIYKYTIKSLELGRSVLLLDLCFLKEESPF